MSCQKHRYYSSDVVDEILFVIWCQFVSDPKDTSNHAQEFVQTLYQRVELKKAEINEADKLKWKYEQSLSKKNATVDKLKHEFNKMLINFNNVEEATNLREVMDQPSLGNTISCKICFEYTLT